MMSCDVAGGHHPVDVGARDQPAHRMRDQVDHLCASGALHAGNVLAEDGRIFGDRVGAPRGLGDVAGVHHAGHLAITDSETTDAGLREVAGGAEVIGPRFPGGGEAVNEDYRARSNGERGLAEGLARAGGMRKHGEAARGRCAAPIPAERGEDSVRSCCAQRSSMHALGRAPSGTPRQRDSLRREREA
jgi:hypothetical protein